MEMSDEEKEQILASARQAVHEIDEKAWMFRCEICRETVKHIMVDLDVDRLMAMSLFVAWTHENAAATFREGVVKQVNGLNDYAKKIAPAIEQIEKEAQQEKPWEHSE